MSLLPPQKKKEEKRRTKIFQKDTRSQMISSLCARPILDICNWQVHLSVWANSISQRVKKLHITHMYITSSSNSSKEKIHCYFYIYASLYHLKEVMDILWYSKGELAKQDLFSCFNKLNVQGTISSNWQAYKFAATLYSVSTQKTCAQQKLSTS